MTSFYFLDESIRGKSKDKNMLRESSDFPVRIRKNTWEHLAEPRRLAKIFSFEDPGQQRYFVSEIMRMVGTMRHNVKIVIDSNMVQIETYTGNIEDITELDLQIARECDQTFEDAQFILETE